MCQFFFFDETRQGKERSKEKEEEKKTKFTKIQTFAVCESFQFLSSFSKRF